MVLLFASPRDHPIRSGERNDTYNLLFFEFFYLLPGHAKKFPIDIIIMLSEARDRDDNLLSEGQSMAERRLFVKKKTPLHVV